MLLFTADVRRVLRGSARLLPCFVVGALGTTLGTLGAFAAVPMTALGAEGWKMAERVDGATHRGGGEFRRRGERVGDDAEYRGGGFGGGIILMNALYFMGLFALAKGVMPKTRDGGDGDARESQGDGDRRARHGRARRGRGRG